MEKKNNNKNNTKNKVKKQQPISEELNTIEVIKAPNKLIRVLLIILLVVAIIAIIVKLTMKPVSEPKIKESNTEKNDIDINKEENVVKNQDIEGLTISNLALISQNGETYLSFNVTNKTTSEYPIKEIHIYLKDKNNNYLINYLDENNNRINYLVGYIDGTLAINETTNVITSIDQEITLDTYDIEYKIMK